jgi:tetratricopeptide (TPR) repeat protein
MYRMRPWTRLGLLILLIAAAGSSAGCSEVRGRRLVKKANELYRQGNYTDAVAAFREAEPLVPELSQLWLNKGYTCRQMLVPGAKTPENEEAVRCALEAFLKLQALRPDDKRAPSLYVQTLFEADRFEQLSIMYQKRAAENARDEEALNSLIQVYSKWPDHTRQALEWYGKKAALKQDDAEAQYAPAVFIWQLLQQKGGGNDKAEFDPRPESGGRRKAKKKEPPAFAADDIVGAARIELADEAVRYLERAVAIRPKYMEAMVYLNLIYRQKAIAYLDKPEEWQKCIDKALEWRDKSLVVQGKPIPTADAGAEGKSAAGSESPEKEK